VDSKSNSYQTAVSKSHNTTSISSHFTHALNIANALVSGDTITVTFNASSTGRGMNVCYCSGVAASSAQDQTASTQGSSAAPTATTAVTTQANEVVFGTVSANPAAGVTEDSAYTLLTDAGPGSIRVHFAYRTLSSTGAQTYAPTLSSSTDWAEVLVTLKSA
jgi:hypothetical protein